MGRGSSGAVPLPATATWGMVVHITSVVLQIIGLATNQWMTAQTGTARITAGLWAVCTISVPYIVDGCDAITNPSATVIAARTFAVFGGIAGPLSFLFSLVVYFLLPTRTFFFFSSIGPLIPAVAGVIATISFGAGAAGKVASGDAIYDLSFAGFLISWLMFLTTAGMYFLAYLKKRNEVQASTHARRNVSGWATSGLKNKKKKKKKKKATT